MAGGAPIIRDEPEGSSMFPRGVFTQPYNQNVHDHPAKALGRGHALLPAHEGQSHTPRSMRALIMDAHNKYVLYSNNYASADMGQGVGGG